RFAQPWAMRYPLIDGQGNFGSRGNDPAAAMRYTECRLSPLAMAMLQDIEEDTVSFSENYDGKTQEPDVLPSRIPNLLINGSVGIAVGMATNIPPHNLREVIDALQLMIGRYGAVVDAGVPFPLAWTRVMRGTSDPEAVQAALAGLPGALGGEVRE